MPVLHVRLDADMVEGLDDLTARLGDGATRSTVVRYILRRAMNEPALQAMLSEEMATLHGMIQSRMSAVRAHLRRAIEEELLDHVDPPQLPEGENEDELSRARRARSGSKVR